MPLAKEVKTTIVRQYGASDKDTGSCQVQIALLTQRINDLGDHFKAHLRDNHSRRGLLKLVSKRRRLLNYLQRENSQEYRKIIDRLKLRK